MDSQLDFAMDSVILSSSPENTKSFKMALERSLKESDKNVQVFKGIFQAAEENMYEQNTMTLINQYLSRDSSRTKETKDEKELFLEFLGCPESQFGQEIEELKAKLEVLKSLRKLVATVHELQKELAQPPNQILELKSHFAKYQNYSASLDYDLIIRQLKKGLKISTVENFKLISSLIQQKTIFYKVLVKETKDLILKGTSFEEIEASFRNEPGLIEVLKEIGKEHDIKEAMKPEKEKTETVAPIQEENEKVMRILEMSLEWKKGLLNSTKGEEFVKSVYGYCEEFVRHLKESMGEISELVKRDPSKIELLRGNIETWFTFLLFTLTKNEKLYFGKAETLSPMLLASLTIVYDVVLELFDAIRSEEGGGEDLIPILNAIFIAERKIWMLKT